jgi:hypothetical protein
MKNKYASFFAVYSNSVKKGNPFTKEEVISNFTNGRTSSLKQLDHWELQELTRNLNQLTPSINHSADKTKTDKMRKAIIAIFYSMDRTVAEAKAWAEKQGVRGVKKSFNQYTTGELYVLISIAEKIKTDWQKSIRKKIQTIANAE